MELPLVKYVIDSFEDINLKNVALIGAQHLLGTTLDLFNYLFTKGLSPKNTFLIGKCYSSSSLVAKEMEKFGIYICSSSFKFISHQSFDKQYSENIETFIRKVLPQAKKNKKIVFLDDGGHLIKIANKILTDFSYVYGVEQTTSGYDVLKNFSLNFPVINVARSSAKLVYESPMIARIVADRIDRSIDSLNLIGKKTLIIGGGAIGRSIYERLKFDVDATIFDSQRKLSMIEASDFDDCLSRSDLIIGCTGKPVLRPKHYRLLKKGVFLISASSSDREFEAVRFRKKAKAFVNPYKNIQIEGINLLNSGFPINFDGHKHSVPAKLIQLTRALLAAGIFQVLNEEFPTKKMVLLDIELQRNLIGKFLSLCGNEYKKFVASTPIFSSNLAAKL